MTEGDNKKRAYQSPRILRLGTVEDLTAGNGEVHPDWLGNPLTKYGQYGKSDAEGRKKKASKARKAKAKKSVMKKRVTKKPAAKKKAKKAKRK